jgi:hypothetical protein
VLQLLYPSCNPWYVHESLTAIPIHDELFHPILEIGGEIAVSLPPGNLPTAASYVSMK